MAPQASHSIVYATHHSSIGKGRQRTTATSLKGASRLCFKPFLTPSALTMKWHPIKTVANKVGNIRPSTIAGLVFFSLIALRALGLTSVADQDQRGRTVVVARVLDGDTFDTRNGERIRLLGIDAPEVAHHDSVEEPFGNESRDWLKATLQHQSVRLTFEQRQQDHYGRTLAWVWLDDRLVNQLSLQTGNSKLLAKYGLPLDLEEGLRKAAAEARVMKIGLWKRK